MKSLNRRTFLKTGAGAGAGAAALNTAAPRIVQAMSRKKSPNDTINIAVMGIRSRGLHHTRNFMNMSNVNVSVICDIDERLFPKALKEFEEKGVKLPKTETDIRRVMEDKDVDAVSIACPNHWHALASVWACQAGKDVYVEKPVSHNIWEGRKIVDAARKYDRIVQTGSQRRSDPLMKAAVDYIQSGELGKVYMVKAVVYRRRGSIGYGAITPVPEGVHYDLFRGPAPWRPFNENRFHYNWHWFWDTGNGETGNNGPHPVDIVRWALNKYDHPKKIQSMGGFYSYDSEQETPNTQLSVMEYADGTILQLEVRNLFTNLDGEVREGLIFYGTEGWMQYNFGKAWTTYFGRENEPGPSMTPEQAREKFGSMQTYGQGKEPHFRNFIDCCRSRKRQDLKAEILEGHLSASLCHLGNIAYRTGRTLIMDSESERFLGDDDANRYLSREYRYPFVVPDEV